MNENWYNDITFLIHNIAMVPVSKLSRAWYPYSIVLNGPATHSLPTAEITALTALIVYESSTI